MLSTFQMPIVMYTCNKRNFNFLASVCSYAEWFESHFVKKPEDMFSRVDGQIERERDCGY